MHRALRPGGDLAALQIIHRIGAKIDAVDEYGHSALFMASAAGYDEVVGWLLEEGADMAITDGDGRTALHVAAARGHVRTCEMLLEHAGAHMRRLTQALDSQGRSPADLAAAARHMDVIRLFLTAHNSFVTERGVAPSLSAISCRGDRDSLLSSPSSYISSPHAPSSYRGSPPRAEVVAPGSAAAKELDVLMGAASPLLHTPSRSVTTGSIYNRVGSPP